MKQVKLVEIRKQLLNIMSIWWFLTKNISTYGVSGGKVPEAESSVPRSGESELSIRGDDNVADEVGVSLKTALGDT